jgi:8-oxo-dGTP diphosphatase
MVRAAGGIVRRDGLVAVVHRPHRADWTLPKGKLEPGEDDEQAALREVREETGWEVGIDADLTTVTYPLPDGREKSVRWYLMHAVAEAGAPEQDVDEVRWLTPDEARALLTYENDRRLLERAGL